MLTLNEHFYDENLNAMGIGLTRDCNKVTQAYDELAGYGAITA